MQVMAACTAQPRVQQAGKASLPGAAHPVLPIPGGRCHARDAPRAVHAEIPEGGAEVEPGAAGLHVLDPGPEDDVCCGACQHAGGGSCRRAAWHRGAADPHAGHGGRDTRLARSGAMLVVRHGSRRTPGPLDVKVLQGRACVGCWCAGAGLEPGAGLRRTCWCPSRKKLSMPRQAAAEQVSPARSSTGQQAEAPLGPVPAQRAARITPAPGRRAVRSGGLLCMRVPPARPAVAHGPQPGTPTARKGVQAWLGTRHRPLGLPGPALGSRRRPARQRGSGQAPPGENSPTSSMGWNASRYRRALMPTLRAAGFRVQGLGVQGLRRCGLARCAGRAGSSCCRGTPGCPALQGACVLAPCSAAAGVAVRLWPPRLAPPQPVGWHRPCTTPEGAQPVCCLSTPRPPGWATRGCMGLPDRMLSRQSRSACLTGTGLRLLVCWQAWRPGSPAEELPGRHGVVALPGCVAVVKVCCGDEQGQRSQPVGQRDALEVAEEEVPRRRGQPGHVLSTACTSVPGSGLGQWADEAERSFSCEQGASL